MPGLLSRAPEPHDLARIISWSGKNSNLSWSAMYHRRIREAIVDRVVESCREAVSRIAMNLSQLRRFLLISSTSFSAASTADAGVIRLNRAQHPIPPMPKSMVRLRAAFGKEACMSIDAIARAQYESICERSVRKQGDCSAIYEDAHRRSVLPRVLSTADSDNEMRVAMRQVAGVFSQLEKDLVKGVA